MRTQFIKSNSKKRLVFKAMSILAIVVFFFIYGRSSVCQAGGFDDLNLTGVSEDKKDWVASIVEPVKSIGREHKLFPSVILSQAILESGWGTSELAENANNYFGIKVTADWQGAVYEKETSEFVNGKYVKVVASFRKYPDRAACFQDYVSKVMNTLFPNGEHRYLGSLRTSAANFREACQAMKDGGWATAPTYAENLSTRIERYRLDALDED